MFRINPDSDKLLKFDMDKVQEFKEDFYDVLTSEFHSKLYELEAIGTYTITFEEYRPDLISYNLYADVQYKMLLMEYNNIFSIDKLVAGTVLKYPALNDMEMIYLQLQNNNNG